MKKNNTKSGKQKTLFRSLFLSLLVISILFASLLIAGCTGNNRPTELNIYTGTQGVTAQLTQNNPPAELYEESEIILMAEVWNKGAFSSNRSAPAPFNAPIYVSVNVDEVYFRLNDATTGNELTNIPSFYLSGKSQSWPIGEKVITPVAKLTVNEIPGTREAPLTKIETSACYPYRTYFAETICVDTDIYSVETDPICRNQKTFSYSGQGAPVIVNKLEVDMIPVRIETGSVESSAPIINASGQIENIGRGTVEQRNIIIEPSFRIYFKNTDKGVILSYAGTENPCVEGPASRGTTIKIKAYLGNLELECTVPDIQMYSSEGSVRCTLPLERIPTDFTLNRNYELPLTVEAEYFYKATTSKDVKIIRVI